MRYYLLNINSITSISIIHYINKIRTSHYFIFIIITPSSSPSPVSFHPYLLSYHPSRPSSSLSHHITHHVHHHPYHKTRQDKKHNTTRTAVCVEGVHSVVQCECEDTEYPQHPHTPPPPHGGEEVDQRWVGVGE